MRLEGTVEPGVYVVTAYGGEKLAWADGAKDEPFRIRPIESKSLAAGVAEGVIGPFGSQRFELSSSANYLRLELPEVAPAQLRSHARRMLRCREYRENEPRTRCGASASNQRQCRVG